MKKMNKEKSIKRQRVPSSFTYDEYRKFFYPGQKDTLPPEDAEALGRELAKETVRAIGAQLKNK